MNSFIEGKAELVLKTDTIATKKLPVFYNPVMKHNRDITILLLKSITKKELIIADPMAASGVRCIRILKELPASKIKEVHLNDLDSKALEKAKKLLEANNCPKKYVLHNQDASQFLLSQTAFDYIDIDPFGSPNPYLDAAIKKIKREGILAVTATDTAPLAGTYINACKRKYWATPLRNEEKHELGLRILIRKVQLIGAQYDKALIPVFTYNKDHYFRIFFKNNKGKEKVDLMLKQHDSYKNAGPLWIGELWDKDLSSKIHQNAEKLFPEDKELNKFLSIIAEESKNQTLGFYDIHTIAKKEKITPIPKTEKILKACKGVQTHFLVTGFKSKLKYEDVVKKIKAVNK